MLTYKKDNWEVDYLAYQKEIEDNQIWFNRKKQRMIRCGPIERFLIECYSLDVVELDVYWQSVINRTPIDRVIDKTR